jgi:hypothetical protein
LGKPFPEPFTFLNEKDGLVDRADRCIQEGDFPEALKNIDAALEWAPNSSELHWRRLLASQNVRNDKELLEKGSARVLRVNPESDGEPEASGLPAWENALKHSDSEEKPVYELILDQHTRILAALKNVLPEWEREDKRLPDTAKLLLDLKRSLVMVRLESQENQQHLEETDKNLEESSLDFNAVAAEYHYAIEQLGSIASKIRGKCFPEMPRAASEQMNSLLDLSLASSKRYLDTLNQLARKHPRAKDYENLREKQRGHQDQFGLNLSTIRKIGDRARKRADALDRTVRDYTDARKDLDAGRYDTALALAGPERTEDVIRGVMLSLGSRTE